MSEFGYNPFDDDEPDIDDFEDHPWECDCPDCEQEHAEMNCGELPEHLGGGCAKAGSEECDFDCPFRNRVLGIGGDEEE